MRSTRPPALPPAPPVDSRIGPYVVIDRIAVGGMAEVFRAEDRSTRPARTLVIKRMLPTLAVDPSARAMFVEEARLGALVEHPGVVKVLGHDEHDGQPYLILEHVPGVDLWRLSRWLTRNRRALDVTMAVHAGRQLLDSLHAVHETRDGGAPLGLVHRDVSPSNVLLSMDGTIKLIDFGIAEARLRESPRLASMVGRAKGKLGYLAPEQVRGENADRRADVFAAAVVIAELLIQKPLFAGGTELAVLLAIRDAQIRPFDELRGTVPDGLHDAIAAALHADPAQRTPTAASLSEALAPFDLELPRKVRARLASLVSEAAGTAVSGATSLHARAAPEPEPSPTEVTRDAPEILYAVQRGAELLGPFSYAKLVEAIATRVVGITDSVSEQGGPFRPLTELPKLFRHLPASSLSETTRDQSGTRASDLVVDLEARSFAAVMGELLLTEESGLLLCTHGNARKEVYLSNGVPEFVTSNLQSELLGEFLVKRGLVSRDELDMALAVMPRFEGRLGDTLTALGLVEPVRLFREIGIQVREKLLELFEWRTGRAEFFRGVPRPQSAFPLGLDPWRILARGVERRIELGLELDLLEGRRGLFLSATRPAPRGLARARLDPPLRATLERAGSGVLLGDLLHGLRDPSGNDVHRGPREVVLLASIGALSISF